MVGLPKSPKEEGAETAREFVAMTRLRYETQTLFVNDARRWCRWIAGAAFIWIMAQSVVTLARLFR